MKGANCADCETIWPLPCSTSRMSISGAPRPTLVDGPGWSSPGHVHDLCKQPKTSHRNTDSTQKRNGHSVTHPGIEIGRTHERRWPGSHDSELRDASDWSAAAGPDPLAYVWFGNVPTSHEL